MITNNTNLVDAPSNHAVKKTNYRALTTIVLLFFFWGFIASSNSILIPFCKTYFTLDQFQSQLLDFSFYVAYFMGSLLMFTWGNIKKYDPLGYMGYKNSLTSALIMSALGSVIIIVSVYQDSFYLLLGGLFIIGLGFSVQQTVINPVMLVIGNSSTVNSRINLGGGVNSFASMIAPIILSELIFGNINIAIPTPQPIQIAHLFWGITVLFLICALILHLSKDVPNTKDQQQVEGANKTLALFWFITLVVIVVYYNLLKSYEQSSADNVVSNLYRLRWLIFSIVGVIVPLIWIVFRNKGNKGEQKGWGALQYPHLVFGMVAIFFYVGIEVCVASNLAELIKEKSLGTINTNEASTYISLYWGSLMIGRWIASIYAFNLNKKLVQKLLLVIGLVAYGTVIGVNYLRDPLSTMMYIQYFPFLCILVLGFWIFNNNAIRILLYCSIAALLAISLSFLNIGNWSLLLIISSGLFFSIMWPSIISLSIMGLGKYTTQGSSFLVMMILGGSLLPTLQGKLADYLQGTPGFINQCYHLSFIIAIIGLLVIILFALLVPFFYKKQNITYAAE